MKRFRQLVTKLTFLILLIRPIICSISLVEIKHQMIVARKQDEVHVIGVTEIRLRLLLSGRVESAGS